MTTNVHENGDFQYRRSEEKLLAVLASGASIRKAAAFAGVSPKTVQRKLADPSFRAQLNEIKAQAVDRAVRHLSASLTFASQTLRGLLKAKSEMARLGAARAVAELHCKLKESADIEERLAAVEEQLANRPKEVLR